MAFLNPKFVSVKKLFDDNEYKYFYSRNNKLGLISWKDRGLVTLLSPFHFNTTTRAERKEKGKDRKVFKEIPTACYDYNIFMRGVDIMDKIILSYSFDHHSHKWWKSCFIALLEIAIHNAYIVYQKKTKDQKTSRLLFRLSIINSLTKGKMTMENKICRSSDFTDCKLGNDKKGDCTICSSKINRHQTRYFYITCNNKICILECFDKHRRVRYAENKINQIENVNFCKFYL